ncbi:MAG TPA: hypothetical protein VGK74_24300 [Symbiobacteriaceae bacterium]|jgi:hypothetical protein
MAETIVARVVSKWRGLLVYALLYGAAGFVSDVIYYRAHTTPLKLYAIFLQASLSFYALWGQWQLLSMDRDGDEGWPPFWK